MKQQTQKKEWTKPELIVLVRSMPEEAVLATCKTGLHGGADNAAQNSGCSFNDCHLPCDSYSIS